MYRIDTTDNVGALPSPAALGTEGYWSFGNPGAGDSATTLDQDWFNALQESLIAVLTAGGVGHSKTDSTRLFQALLRCTSFVDSGSAGAIVVAAPVGFPAPALAAGLSCRIVVAAGNPSAAVTLGFMGATAVPVVRRDGSALVSYDLLAGVAYPFRFDGANWRLQSPAWSEGSVVLSAPGAGIWTVLASEYEVEAWGAGGGGGGADSLYGAGGSSGAYARRRYAGQQIGATVNYIIGAHGTGGASTAAGTAGGATSWGSGPDFSAPGGQGGAPATSTATLGYAPSGTYDFGLNGKNALYPAVLGSVNLGGQGGDAPGGGGGGGPASSAGPDAAGWPGAGGPGGSSGTGVTNNAGGNGADGGIVIRWRGFK